MSNVNKILPGMHNNGPLGWSSNAFMNEMRVRITKLQQPPCKIMKYGHTILSIKDNPKVPINIMPSNAYASGIVDCKGKTTIQLNLLHQKEPTFNIGNIEGMKEFKGDIALFINFGGKIKHKVLVEGKPFVVGRRSPDSKNILKYLGEGFPSYAFALTYEGSNIFKIENLSKEDLSVFLFACRPYPNSNELIEKTVEKNAIKLEVMVSIGDLDRIGIFPNRHGHRFQSFIPGYEHVFDVLPDILVPVRISSNGEILGFGFTPCEQEEYYEFYLSYEDQRFNVMDVTRSPESNFKIPLQVKEVLEKSIDRYNSL